MEVNKFRILEIYDDKDKLGDYLITRQRELADQVKETEYKLMHRQPYFHGST